VSFKPVFIAVVIASALIVGAFLLNRARPRVEIDQPSAEFVRASGKCAECHTRQQYSVVHEYETYESIPRFMPDVTRSVVRARQPGRAIVEQEAVSRVALFVKRVRLVLDIVEEDQALRFTDICSRSFAQYEGAWRFLPRDNGTEITYELTARPSFEVPDFLLKRVLKRNAVRMIDQLRDAIAARAAPRQ